MSDLPEPADKKKRKKKDLFEEDPEWIEPEVKETHHIGLWMMVGAWVAAIIVMAVIFDSWLAKHYDPQNVEQKIMTVEGVHHTVITRNRYNQYIAKGSINNYPVTFLLDTGATDVVIPGELAKELNLKMGYRGYANTAGGQVKIYSTRIKELIVGHIRILNIRASINPSMSGDQVLLGMSALKHVTFSQRGDKLILVVEP